MKRLLLLAGLLACRTASAQVTTPVMVQNFEKVAAQPKAWVVKIPNENATVKLTTEHPYQGQQSLKLHYHFTGTAGQYLGVPIPVKIQAPIHKLHWMLYGDGSSTGCGVYVSDSSGETHKYRSPAAMKIDFKGWKEIDVDLDAPHEIWGGDKNGKIDYPITAITFEISHDGMTPIESDLYFDALRADSEKSALETLGGSVSVVSPAYGAGIKGNTRIVFAAPGFKRVTVTSWKPDGAFGTKSTVATIALDAKGSG